MGGSMGVAKRRSTVTASEFCNLNPPSNDYGIGLFGRLLLTL
jgi:hypothetical protein